MHIYINRIVIVLLLRQLERIIIPPVIDGILNAWNHIPVADYYLLEVSGRPFSPSVLPAGYFFFLLEKSKL